MSAVEWVFLVAAALSLLDLVLVLLLRDRCSGCGSRVWLRGEGKVQVSYVLEDGTRLEVPDWRPGHANGTHRLLERLMETHGDLVSAEKVTSEPECLRCAFWESRP